jgi:hypothetical protein
MKRTLSLVAVLLLTCSIAWAEETASAPDPVADSGGGCMLPDLAGMSPEQITAAALEAGFQPAPNNVQVPVCPVTFHCNSITNCGIGPLCALGNLGQCCNAGGGLTLCCISGTIKVKTCPCRCTGNPCNIQCPNSNEVNWGCS